jgi:hypothetical protein
MGYEFVMCSAPAVLRPRRHVAFDCIEYKRGLHLFDRPRAFASGWSAFAQRARNLRAQNKQILHSRTGRQKVPA